MMPPYTQVLGHPVDDAALPVVLYSGKDPVKARQVFETNAANSAYQSLERTEVSKSYCVTVAKPKPPAEPAPVAPVDPTAPV